MTDDKKVDVSFSRDFVTWLSRSGGSLLVSSYQAGRLLSIGTKDEAPWIRLASFNKCMGFFERQGAMAIATSNRIILSIYLAGDTQQEPFDLDNDRVYYPRMAWFTGDLKAHDIVLTHEDAIVFANTAYDCLATVDASYSFRPLWYPPFLKPSAKTDRCHLNGIGLVDGQPSYVTALGQGATPGGWREHKRSGGLLMHVASSEIVNGALSMPHSPRWYRDRLWILNSGTGDFGTIDPESGRFEPLTFCSGFARGLCFHDRWAIIGLSNMRRYDAFKGLELGERLDAQGISPVCGLIVVNLDTGKIEHWLALDGKVQELYDVAFVAASQRPLVITPEQRETLDLCLLPPETLQQARNAPKACN